MRHSVAERTQSPLQGRENPAGDSLLLAMAGRRPPSWSLRRRVTHNLAQKQRKGNGRRGQHPAFFRGEVTSHVCVSLGTHSAPDFTGSAVGTGLWAGPAAPRACVLRRSLEGALDSPHLLALFHHTSPRLPALSPPMWRAFADGRWR